jgi:hypothetical protein
MTEDLRMLLVGDDPKDSFDASFDALEYLK